MGLAALVLALSLHAVDPHNVSVTEQTSTRIDLQCVWTGAGTNNLWSNPANWSGCPVPFPVDYRDGFLTILFPNGARQTTNVNDLANVRVNFVIIEGRGAAPALADWQITGNQVTLAGRLNMNTGPHPTGGAGGPAFLAPIKLDDTRALGSCATVIEVLNVTEPVVGDIDVNTCGLFTFLTGGSLTIRGHITGEFGREPTDHFHVLGGHTLTLFDNSYRGFMIVEGATGAIVRLMSDHALGAAGDQPNNTLLTPGSRVELGPGTTIPESFVIDLRRPIVTIGVPAGSATLTGTISTPRSEPVKLVLALGGTLTIAGPITQIVDPTTSDIELRQEGGTLIMANEVDDAKRVVVARGTLRAGQPQALANVNVTLSEGSDIATLDLRNTETHIGSLSGSAGGRVVLGSGTLFIQQTLGETYAGTIAGTGSLVKQATGELTLTGPAANTFTGQTLIQGGRLVLAKSIPNAAVSAKVRVGASGHLVLGANEQIPDANIVTVDSAGFLETTDREVETITGLTGSGTIDVRRGTLTIASSRSSQFDGVLRGTPDPDGSDIRLIKNGAGTFTFTGGGNLGGKLALDAGVLTIDGALAMRNLLVRGGSLNGTGQVFNSVSLPDDRGTIDMTSGTLAPGHGHEGILQADGLRMDAGTLLIRLAGGGPGFGYNQLALTGNVILAPAARLVVTRTFTVAKGVGITVVDLAPGRTVTGTFSGLPEGKTFALDGQTFRITYHGGLSGNDVVLTALDGPPLPLSFLSEGFTDGAFDTELHVANPNDVAAAVTMTFVLDDGTRTEATTVVPAQSHRTVKVDEMPGLEHTSFSTIFSSDNGVPIGIERSLLWDATHYAGTSAMAVDQPSREWFFAEGDVHRTGSLFDTDLVLFNPSPAAAAVTVQFLGDQGTYPPATFTVFPMTRLRVPLITMGVVDLAFGMAVHATQPIVAERTTYHDGQLPLLPSGGSTSMGVTAPATRWDFAEGLNGTDLFTTYFLVANPQPTPANVVLRFRVLGTIATVLRTVPAGARLSLRSADLHPLLRNAGFATTVTSDIPVVVDRTTYVQSPRGPESQGGAGISEPGLTWLIAGASVGVQTSQSTILLRNPTATPATVTLTCLRENAPPITQTVTVPPDLWIVVDASTIAGLQNENFGVRVESTNGVPITVERTMYWGANGVPLSGGSHINAVRLP
jgi:autotransporter-associated beta strand protein